MPATSKRRQPSKRSLLRQIKALKWELEAQKRLVAKEEKHGHDLEKDYYREQTERYRSDHKLATRAWYVETLMKHLADPANYKRLYGQDYFVLGAYAQQMALNYLRDVTDQQQVLARIRSDVAQGIVTRLEASPTDMLREEIGEIRRHFVKEAA